MRPDSQRLAFIPKEPKEMASALSSSPTPPTTTTSTAPTSTPPDPPPKESPTVTRASSAPPLSPSTTISQPSISKSSTAPRTKSPLPPRIDSLPTPPPPPPKPNPLSTIFSNLFKPKPVTESLRVQIQTNQEGVTIVKTQSELGGGEVEVYEDRGMDSRKILEAHASASQGFLGMNGSNAGENGGGEGGTIGRLGRRMSGVFGNVVGGGSSSSNSLGRQSSHHQQPTSPHPTLSNSSRKTPPPPPLLPIPQQDTTSSLPPSPLIPLDPDQDFEKELEGVMALFRSSLETLPEEMKLMYVFVGLLGYGGNGFVTEAYTVADNSPVAIKFLPKRNFPQSNLTFSPKFEKVVPMEIEILSYCDHPNIVKFIRYHEGKEFWYLVMELTKKLTWRLGDENGEEDEFISDGVQQQQGVLRRTNTLGVASPLRTPVAEVGDPMGSGLAAAPVTITRRSLDESLLKNSTRPPNVDEESPGLGLGLDTTTSPSSASSKTKPETSSIPPNSNPAPHIQHPLQTPRHPHPSSLYDFLTMYALTPPPIQKHIFRQLISAYTHLRSLGFVYLDFRGENILIDDNLTIKLVDFGMAQREITPSAQGREVFMQYGTPEASAPEVLLNQGFQGPEADVWALGLVLYLLITGGEDAFNSREEALSGVLRFPDGVEEGSVRELVKGMLEVDWRRRWGVEKVGSCDWLRE
ncbi:hypothetical protein HDV05_000888 [Chytridiales sp. JEL 0842]|nr:hypothetical protein HDV05_000888 [Chytridiales sp. JEL 0842]